MHDYDAEYERLAPAIADLVPLIRQHADQADDERRLPAPVAEAIARAGLHRLAVPRSVDGAEAHPLAQVRVIEDIAMADGAAGWNLMIGVEVLGIASAAFPTETARRHLSDPGVILCGALNPQGKAVRAEGGYVVSGVWPFGSGSHNAHYFYGQCVVHENERPARDDQGPLLLEALIPRADYEIRDTWQVSGLRGSGSHDVAVREAFVPDERTTRLTREPLEADGTLYRVPQNCRLAYNKVGVATGIARAAIDAFVTLATEKTPRGHVSKLRERADAQLAVAEAEYELRAARTLVFEATNAVWDAVASGGQPSTRQRALLQLACSGAATAAVNAVEKVYRAAGATANFKSSPLERCMRDVLVVRQHLMVSPQWHQSVGRVLLGLDSGTFLF